MTEAKIPARWQGLWADATMDEVKPWHWMQILPRKIKQLIEELAAAERRSEYWKAEHLAGNAEIDRLRAEVERLKGDYNVLLDDCIDMRRKLTQARRDALEEAAYEAEGAHVNDERSDIARLIRALADKEHKN